MYQSDGSLTRFVAAYRGNKVMFICTKENGKRPLGKLQNTNGKEKQSKSNNKLKREIYRNFWALKRIHGQYCTVLSDSILHQGGQYFHRN